MTNSPADLDAQLRALKEEYAAQLPGKVAQLRSTWNALWSGEWNPREFQNLHRGVHSLVGSSGTYGFPALCRQARAAEVHLKSMLPAESAPSENQRREIDALLGALQVDIDACPDALRPLEAPVSSVSDSVPSHDSAPSHDGAPSWRMPSPAFGAIRSGNRLVFLVEKDVHLAQDLASQLCYFGYTVRVFDRLAGIAEAHAVPAAILLDALMLEQETGSHEILAAIPAGADGPAPVLVLADHGDLPARMAAVRAGAQGYFVKPVEISPLISRLEEFTYPLEPEPFRVLIVDDAPEMAEFLGKQLEQAGVVVALVTDPLQILQPLAELNPDLILMDVYMPGCTGLELATVIRQQEEYVSIPIVYLSSETDTARQLQALRLGGDDFMTKPVDTQHFVPSVLTRLQRSCVLRSYMARDGLTGLLNHTTLEERLATEIAHAKRQNNPLAFAMLDLDRFKSINDTYGHPAGDRVRKSLAQLLQRRLRRTDTIGRYGGEEFAAILIDIRGHDAVRVLDELRLAFGRLAQQAANVEFSVTFSCGIALYPQHPDAVALVQAADQALYQAKSRGRNCVVLAE